MDSKLNLKNGVHYVQDLFYCGLLMVWSILVLVGNGLIPEGTKPLPKPMLTRSLWHLYWGHVYLITQVINSQVGFEIHIWNYIRCGSNFRCILLKPVIQNSSLGTHCQGWMPENFTDDKSTLVQVMAWCLQAITWANIDPDLCCHMASLGHNELIWYTCYHSCCITVLLATQVTQVKIWPPFPGSGYGQYW